MYYDFEIYDVNPATISDCTIFHSLYREFDIAKFIKSNALATKVERCGNFFFIKEGYKTFEELDDTKSYGLFDTFNNTVFIGSLREIECKVDSWSNWKLKD